MLEDMVFIENVKLLYRINADLAPVPFKYLFSRQTHKYKTRRESFVVPKFT